MTLKAFLALVAMLMKLLPGALKPDTPAWILFLLKAITAVTDGASKIGATAEAADSPPLELTPRAQKLLADFPRDRVTQATVKAWAEKAA